MFHIVRDWPLIIALIIGGLLLIYPSAAGAQEVGDGRTAGLIVEQSAINAMPVLGVVQVGGRLEVSADVDDLFVGKPVVGVIELANDTIAAVEIGEITSSCGCTVARKSTKIVESGSREKILVNIVASDPGPFKSSIRILLGSDPVIVTIKGRALYPLTAKSLTLEAGDSGLREFIMEINDRSIDIESLDFDFVSTYYEVERQSVNDREACLYLRSTMPFKGECSFVVYPRAGVQGLPPLRGKVVKSGFLACKPSNVYISRDDYSTKLFLVGDLESLKQKHDDELIQVAIAVEPHSSEQQPHLMQGSLRFVMSSPAVARATVEFPSDSQIQQGTHDVVVKNSDFEFSFVLHVR